MKNKKMYTEELPYEKFEKRGSESLTDAELLAIIIRSGSKDASALQIAREILKIREGENGLLSLHHISVKELKQIRGIGDVNAIKIKCIAELSKRISMANARNNLKFRSPRTVADYYMDTDGDGIGDKLQSSRYLVKNSVSELTALGGDVRTDRVFVETSFAAIDDCTAQGSGIDGIGFAIDTVALFSSRNTDFVGGVWG